MSRLTAGERPETVTKYTTKPWLRAKRLTTHAAAGATTNCGRRVGTYGEGWCRENNAVDCGSCLRAIR